MSVTVAKTAGFCFGVDRAVEMVKKGRPKTAMAYVDAALGELLEILELVPADGPTGDMTVQVLSYCTENFTEDITVKTLAQALFISESYVSKLFTQKLKCSFRAYINTLRINKAQTLLRDTEKKILQIMTACGFRNQSSFNRVFLELTGVSPKDYRQANQK